MRPSKLTVLAWILLHHICALSASVHYAQDLVSAARYGNVDLVKRLLECGANVNATDSKGDCALVVAKTARIIELLHSKGADIEATRRDNSTALHLACYDGNLQVVELLLNLCANVNKLGYQDRTPLMHVFHYPPSHHHVDRANRDPSIAAKLVSLLLDYKANIARLDKSFQHILHFIVRSNDLDCLKLVLERGGRDLINLVDIRGETALFCAAKHSRQEIVSLLLASRANDTIAALYQGKYPIHSACEGNRLDNVKLLLNKESIKFSNFFGQSAFHTACQLGYLDIANCLVENGVTIDSSLSEFLLYLGCASKYKHVSPNQLELVALALDNAECDLSASTSLLFSACKYGSKEVVRLFVQRFQQPSLDVYQEGNESLIMAACSRPDGFEIIEYLIGCGADPNLIHPITGETALFYACRFGTVREVQLLFENMHDRARRALRYDSISPLFEACLNNRPLIVQFLLEHDNDNCYIRYDQNILPSVFARKNFANVERLLGPCIANATREQLQQLSLDEPVEPLYKLVSNLPLDRDERERLCSYISSHAYQIVATQLPISIRNFFFHPATFGKIAPGFHSQVAGALVDTDHGELPLIYTMVSMFKLFYPALCPLLVQGKDGIMFSYLRTMLLNAQKYVLAKRDGQSDMTAEIHPNVLYFLQQYIFKAGEVEDFADSSSIGDQGRRVFDWSKLAEYLEGGTRFFSGNGDALQSPNTLSNYSHEQRRNRLCNRLISSYWFLIEEYLQADPLIFIPLFMLGKAEDGDGNRFAKQPTMMDSS